MTPSPPVTLPRERVRAWQRQVLVALVAQLGSIGFMVLVAWQGIAPWALVLAWAPLSMLGSAVALAALQFGWSHRLEDPALTAPQMVWANLSTAACYAMCGPVRGAVFVMLCLTLLFSIFALPARTVRWLAGYTLVLFGVVMATMAWLQPARYPALQEGVTFMLMAFAIPAMAQLATRMSQLRQQLGRQRQELQEALERIRVMASHDELTALPNRRFLAQTIERARGHSERGRGFSLALVDLDHFKRVNDTHGHAVGDLVLRQFATVARSAVRAEDTVGRWGGEEFLVVFEGSPPEGALIGARRVCELAAADGVALPGGGTLHYTVSIGLVSHRRGETAEQTIERADALLYRAKAEGRNQVRLDTDSEA